MPYPDSPFPKTFTPNLITSLLGEKSQIVISNEKYSETLKWLCSNPKLSSYRVNRLKYTTEEVLVMIQESCKRIFDKSLTLIEIHPLIPDVVIIYNNSLEKEMLQKFEKEIIVDPECACAILRGAHVYAPGVTGMVSGIKFEDNVSIYADVSRKCKKGFQKLYEDENKIFIGNGLAKMQRHELFVDSIKPRGVAVEVTESISGCPPLGDTFLPPGSTLLQNLPSILCVLALNPRPGESVLDMCASPGNKSVHIAELMKNEGAL